MNSKQLAPILAAIVVIVAGAAIFFFTRGDQNPVLPIAATSTAAPAATTDPAATSVAKETTAPAGQPAPTQTAETTQTAPTTGSDLMTPGPLGDRALGDPKAPVTIVEYASMTCSHCQRFHSEVYPELKKKYIDTGKVYFIFREFPLDPLALAAIALARCAPPERYFPIVDLLFDTQKTWAFVDDPKTALLGVVKQAGFTQASFEACLTDQKIADGINWVRTRGAETFKVEATPTFFFNGKMERGEMSIAEIDKLLAPYL
ncbi:MAG: DsbA family protein [Bauldia sp.]